MSNPLFVKDVALNESLYVAEGRVQFPTAQS